MIQKTPAEKQQLKEAKKAHRQGIRQQAIEKERQKNDDGRLYFSTVGIKTTESILRDNYPVFIDHFYVIDQGIGKVIRSDIAGNIGLLKKDLWQQGYLFENIYNCDLEARRVNN